MKRLAPVLLSLVAAACSKAPQTQIIVVFETDMKTPDDMDQLTIQIDTDTQTARFFHIYDLDEKHVTLPRTLALYPEGDTSLGFRITARGLKNEAPVVQRSASTAFVPGETLLLRMPLRRTCRLVACADGQTCDDAGGCGTDSVPPTALPKYNAKTVHDASVPEAPVADATVDTGVDVVAGSGGSGSGGNGGGSGGSGSGGSGSGGSGSGGSGSGGAVSTLKIQYRRCDASTSTASSISPCVRLVNLGTSILPLSGLKIRYWFSKDAVTSFTWSCHYASIPGNNPTGTAVLGTGMTDPRADSYFDLGLTSGEVAVGASLEIHYTFHDAAYGTVTLSNDYSFDATNTAYADWDRITVYKSGVLIWGIEPS